MESVCQILALLLALAQSGAGQSKGAGEWYVEMRREGWSPAVCRGTLRLQEGDGAWQGDIRFHTILGGQVLALDSVEVRGSRVELKLTAADQELSFEGTLKDGVITGTCDWKGVGRFPFRAEGEEALAPPRFDEGLSYRGYLPKGEPARLGIDESALDELVRQASRRDTDALLVLKDGKVVAEQYFGGPRGRVHLMSVTKFLTAMAAAWLLEDADIESLEEPVSTWYPEWGEGQKAKVTLRHLLSHTSGIEYRASAQLLNQQSDKVEFVRGIQMVAEPGTRHLYSNEGVALLGGILGDAAGSTVDEYLDRRLFRPLGIEDWAWDRDGSGNTITYAQAALTARDLGRIGQLLVERGKLGKKQVFPEAWIDRLATPGSDLDRYRGLLWRLYYDKADQELVGFGHTGWLGQYLVVYPGWKLVGVRLRHFKSEYETDNETYSFGVFEELLRDLVEG